VLDRLPRREREVAEIVYACGEASAQDICRALPDRLSNAAVRSMLQRIEAKGLVRRRKDGRKYLYSAVLPDRASREAALRRIARDYFDGSLVRVVRMLEDMREKEESAGERLAADRPRRPVPMRSAARLS
jgi:predicted transcriptional regulator